MVVAKSILSWFCDFLPRGDKVSLPADSQLEKQHSSSTEAGNWECNSSLRTSKSLMQIITLICLMGNDLSCALFYVFCICISCREEQRLRKILQTQLLFSPISLSLSGFIFILSTLTLLLIRKYYISY